MHKLGYWGFNFYILYIWNLRFKCLNSFNKGDAYAYFVPMRARCIHNKPLRRFSRNQHYYYTIAILHEDVKIFHETSRQNSTYPTLNPWFVTGFTDGEGCFMISFGKSEARFGFRIRAIFQINLHKKDLELLKNIQIFFGGIGYITNAKYNSAFRVRSIKDLQVIIAHFDKFPLKTKKQADFELFKCAVDKLSRKEHLKLKGFKEIVNIRASMNLGLTDVLQNTFPEAVPVVVWRPLVKNEKVTHPDWLAGFSSGEGCFFINISKSSSNKVGYKVSLLFAIFQHSRDRELLERIKEDLDCGAVKESPARGNNLTYKVTKFTDISEKIVPFFHKHRILGIKSKDFNDWCQVVELIKDKKNLTPEGLEEIRQIKSGMNTGRLYDPEEETL